MHATATVPATLACGVAGSRQWMAPELLDTEHCSLISGEAERAGKPTKQSDLYALALTIWEV
jgi:serine/threonine protein kinase